MNLERMSSSPEMRGERVGRGGRRRIKTDVRGERTGREAVRLNQAPGMVRGRLRCNRSPEGGTACWEASAVNAEDC